MNRWLSLRGQHTPSVPRVSGDEPLTAYTCPAGVLCSPRKRG